MAAWVIHAWEHGILAESCYRDGYIAIYWNLGGAPIESLTREEIVELYSQYYPESNANKLGKEVGEVYHFSHDMCEGDTIIMPDPSAHTYRIGEIIGPCHFDNTDHFHHEGSYKRDVIWQTNVSYDVPVSESTRRSLNSGQLTVYKARKDVLDELINASQSENKSTVEGNDKGLDQVINNIEAASYKEISERIMNLLPIDMERLVAGLLRAMGYKTKVTPYSGDGGFDIKATLDSSINALGFDEPNLVVEVKQRKGKMDAPTIRGFIGILHDHDRGLYVSTGGFTKSAQEASNQTEHPVKLLDIDDFIRLYTEYYENTDEETRTILPLKRIYWPE